MITKKGGIDLENNMIIKDINDKIVVYFQGEIDCLNTPVYREKLTELIENTTGDMIFDFKDTTFIDSSGIGLVLGRYNQLKFDERSLILTDLNPVAYRLFELTGLFKIMPYYKNIESLREGIQ